MLRPHHIINSVQRDRESRRTKAIFLVFLLLSNDPSVRATRSNPRDGSFRAPGSSEEVPNRRISSEGPPEESFQGSFKGSIDTAMSTDMQTAQNVLNGKKTDSNTEANAIRDIFNERGKILEIPCAESTPVDTKTIDAHNCVNNRVCDEFNKAVEDNVVDGKECELLKQAIRRVLGETDTPRFLSVRSGPPARFVIGSVALIATLAFVVARIDFSGTYNVPDEEPPVEEEESAPPREPFDSNLVSVLLLDYDGCLECISPVNPLFQIEKIPSQRKRDAKHIKNMMHATLDVLKGKRGRRPIAFCASARQGPALDYNCAVRNKNGFALGGGKNFQAPQKSAFDEISRERNWALNKATLADYGTSELYDACVALIDEDECRVDGREWTTPVKGASDVFSKKGMTKEAKTQAIKNVGSVRDWYNPKGDRPSPIAVEHLMFDESIKVAIAENALRALKRMPEAEGGLTAEEKAEGVNVFFLDDREELLTAVRTHAKIPDLGFEVNFFTVNFMSKQYILDDATRTHLKVRGDPDSPPVLRAFVTGRASSSFARMFNDARARLERERRGLRNAVPSYVASTRTVKHIASERSVRYATEGDLLPPGV
mgnify:CR=1 FL=1